MPQRPSLSTLLFVLVLPACAIGGGGRFACPHPDGVTCMSPTAIYRATDDRRHLESPSAASASSGKQRSATASRHPEDALRETPEGGARRAADPGYRVEADGLRLVDADARWSGVELAPETSPYRTAAQVLRIWIAPWEDESGDLHLASRVYTEIEGRRWLVAEPHARQRGTSVMQLVSSPAAARPDPAPPTPAKSPPPAGHPNDGSPVVPVRK